MNPDITAKTIESGDGSKVTGQIVFQAAVSSAIFGALYLIGLLGKLIVDGTVHSVSAPPVRIVSAIVALLLDISLLILFAALRRQTAESKLVFADLAVLFMTLLCAASSMSWFAQLAVLPKIEAGTETTLVALVDIHNEGSLLYATEHLAWGIFYGLATIFMALALGTGRWEGWIRWLLIAGGLLSIIHVLGVVTSNRIIGDLGYLAWGVLLPATTVLVAIRSART